jgi:formylmethanofuran dehydrogenase subunit B
MPTRELDADLHAAARLLAASDFPVIAGLQTDVAGIVAAIRLAERLRGAVDHAASKAVLHEAAVFHDAGLMLITPGEARRLADTFLLVGHRPLVAWPELPEFLFSERAGHPEATSPQRILALIPRRATWLDQHRGSALLECNNAALPGVLAAIRARLGGRPAAETPGIDVGSVVEQLQSARFGVAIWSPDALDALTIEMLAGLVKDLNAQTRWSALSVAGDASAVAATIACGWTAGFPLRVGFGRGHPEYDSWRFDARRLVDSREADAIVWVSALGELPPAWIGAVPTVVLSDSEIAPLPGGVAIRVARLGRDHAAVIYDRCTGTLIEVPARLSPDSRRDPPVAEVLNGIGARLVLP